MMGITTCTISFFIFDYRDSSVYTDDWVWTGSYNVTYWGTVANTQNVVTIHDHDVASAYTEEFEEMWGLSDNSPNPGNAKFSYYKTDNTEHQFNVDGVNIEVYFSPSDNFKDNLVNKIETTNYESYFSIFYFSHRDISNALKDVWNGRGDCALSNIRGIFDEGCWTNNYNSEAIDISFIPGSCNPWHPGLDTNLAILRDNICSDGLLHHKYLIIDVEHSESGPRVITVSTNWSYWGDNYNDGNSIFIQSDFIANQYFQEWMARYKEAGGEFSGIISENYNRSITLILSTDIIVNELIIYLFLNENIINPIIDVINLTGQKFTSFPLNKVGDGLYTVE